MFSQNHFKINMGSNQSRGFAVLMSNEANSATGIASHTVWAIVWDIHCLTHQTYYYLRKLTFYHSDPNVTLLRYLVWNMIKITTTAIGLTTIWETPRGKFLYQGRTRSYHQIRISPNRWDHHERPGFMTNIIDFWWVFRDFSGFFCIMRSECNEKVNCSFIRYSSKWAKLYLETYYVCSTFSPQVKLSFSICFPDFLHYLVQIGFADNVNLENDEITRI